jgi:hypothetical protein
MMSPAPLAHSARSNLYQNEAHWRLADAALERSGGEPAKAPWWARALRFYLLLIVPWGLDRIDRGGDARFPYASIKQLRLSYEPTRIEDNRHRCALKLSSGEKAMIYSTHFTGFDSFEDRAASYRPLVRELVMRVAAANPACTFWAGKSRLVYWTQHIFLLVLLLLMVFVLGYFSGFNLSELAMAKLAVIIGFIPLAFLYARKNYPQRFAPPDIPHEVLPRA